jgi:maltose alpha-D-glucosyltransferase/alpha-amylase
LDSVFTLVRVTYKDGDDDLYTLPLALLDPERAVLQGGVRTDAILSSIRHREDKRRFVLVDATCDGAFWQAFDELARKRKSLKGQHGSIRGLRIAGNGAPAQTGPEEIQLSSAEQSNSSAIFGREFIIKLFRRVEEGVNPDYEIGSHLTKSKRFANTPPINGALEYRNDSDFIATLGTKQLFVPNEGDAWKHALDAVSMYYERALATAEEDVHPTQPPGRPIDHAQREVSEEETLYFDGYLELLELLGRRTGEMHLALADSKEEQFRPEPFSKLYLRSLYQTLRNGVRRPRQTLRRALPSLEGDARALAEEVMERRDEILGRIDLVRNLPLKGQRIRCHGDYHLGQVLWTGMDFMIIDFEGEPMRSLGERRLKRSCLSDVAGMCRSIDYAANAGMARLADQGMIHQTDGETEALHQLANYWAFCVQAAFLRGYLKTVGEPLIPESVDDIAPLLEAWTLNKCAYEVDYELNNRPDWVSIPLRGILRLLDTPPSTPSS